MADPEQASTAPAARASTSSALDQPTPVTIKCGCKRTLKDNAITTEPRYGFWRSMTLLFGITAAPQRIDYVCMACGKTVAQTQETDVIRKHTH